MNRDHPRASVAPTAKQPDVDIFSSTAVTAYTVPIEEWYMLANGDVQPEWLVRRPFA